MIGFGPTIWSKQVRRDPVRHQGAAARRLHLDGRHVPARAQGRQAAHGIHRLLRHAGAGCPHVVRRPVKPGDEDRVFYKLAVWKRIIIMLGGPTMNLLIAIVLYAIVLCVFGCRRTARRSAVSPSASCPPSSTQTECTDDDQPAPACAAGLKPGDRFVSIDGEQIDSADEVGEIIRRSAGETIEVVIERDGSRADASSSRPILNRARGAQQPRPGRHRSRRQPGHARSRLHRYRLRGRTRAEAGHRGAARGRGQHRRRRQDHHHIAQPARAGRAGGVRRRRPRPERADQRRRHRPHRGRDRQLRPADHRRPSCVAAPDPRRA